MSGATHYYDGAEQHMMATINGRRYLLTAPPTYNNMASLGGKVTFGDYTQDSDENSSAKIWSDFSGGIGIENIREGSDDGAYWYGYAGAKNPFQLSLPRETLERTNVKYPLGNFNGKFYGSDGTTLFTWDETTLAFVDTTYTIGATPHPGRCAVFDGSFWIPCGIAGVVEFTGSGNGTLDTSVKALDLMEYDNHLYAITSDKKLCRYDGTSWSDLETFKWGDTPRCLAIFMNRLEDDILYIATSRGLIGWDKTNSAGYRTRFQPPISHDNGVSVVPWRAGENLYYPSGMQLYQYNVSAAIPVGPGGREGVPARVRGRIVGLESSFNSLFALIEGATEEPVPTSLLVSVELSNPDFDVNDDDWSITDTDAGITATFARDATEDASDGTGAGELNISANTASQGDGVTVLMDGAAVPAAAGVEFTYTAWVKVDDTDLCPRLAIEWLDNTDTPISTTLDALWSPTLTTWEEVSLVATAPAGSVSARIGVFVEDRNVAGGTTGSVWIDDLTFERDDIGAYLEVSSIYDDVLEAGGLATTALATVMEYNGAGWHPCWESSVVSGVPFRIVASSELDHERVFWGYGDSVFTQKLSKTSSLIRQQWEAREARFAPFGYIDTGWFDGNMKSFRKLANRLEVNVDNVTPGAWFAVDYRIDNQSSWTSLSGPVTVADNGTEGKIVIPFGVETISIDGVTAQFSRGVGFDRIRFRVRMETDDPQESCFITSIVLKFVKQAEVYPLFGLSIDVSTKSEELLGRTASEIRAELTELTSAREFAWLRLGDFNKPVMRVLITAERGTDATGLDQSAVRSISVVGYPLPGYEGLPADYAYEP